MSTGLSVSLVVGAYLLGSVSFSVVIVKLSQGLDVRSVGSGNAGATNALRAAGRKAGAAVLALDITKGVTAVIVPRLLDAPPAVVGSAAVAVVVGHVYPVFFGFRGGKGVATSLGALGALAPVAMALGIVLFGAIVAWKRYVSLGSIVTAAAFPFLAWACHRLGWTDYGGSWLLGSATAISFLIVLRHAGNLQRLWAGTEPRLAEPKPEPARGARR